MKQLIDAHLLTVPGCDEFLSFEGWLATADYSEARKTQIREALSENSNDTHKWKRYKVDTHVKDEFYDEIKPLRLINARHDYTKAVLGPIIKVIEKRVCKLKWFIKYVPVSQRPAALQEMLERPGMSYALTDFTSFEAQFIPSIMEALERPLYKRMTSNFCDQLKFLTLFDRTLCGINNLNVCKKFRAQISGVRMSGEMDTSLANGWCNLVLFMFVLWDKGVQMSELLDLCGFVEGDDGIFALPDHLLPCAADYVKIGFIIKIDITRDLNLASFCGNIFAPGDNIVITDPIKAMSKLGWCSRKYLSAGTTVQMALLRAKALSIAHQYNGCPLLSKLGRRLVHLTQNVRFRKNFLREAFDEFERGKIVLDLPPEKETPLATRHTVHEMYGITIEQQLTIESDFSTMELGPYVLPISSPWEEIWDRYVDVDPPVDQGLVALTLCDLKLHYLKCSNPHLSWKVSDL